ncbi:auxilin-like clathrin-binding protein required for normal clathrin function [Exophiala dermatitidis]|uniref:Non-specific serine/threonine protein kinase n=2 Tax=Exophiala dermatitidis TaxID=5970 RepID=H6BVX9_EXODN|nr:non-specific serine/threonine protein kinase [Exophiala dermatitidis NIH/UT8656]KAJ4508116.1 auxilin-like clathrin-binding protein required for normal clathrin function [Exophiala dermatitidis]EHY55133.1 non-specific serine/threonine protein kinase [Exophiala dermatitidis NIH/UT8656]KAJ4510784.1 auxilin-like clathrin-binding protein required for normal clathrin function [Exophiala dermatitidis]KAJ4513170.1 auxilin-like clathrin-binding protein required for normal clathrin function [Exophiala
MDELAGLNWSSTPGNAQKPATSNYSAFSTLKPTPPASGRASPLNQSSSKPGSKSATPSNDSFANLVSFGGNSNKNLSLLEQQRRLTEAKLQEQQAKTQTIKDQFAGGDDQFWNNLGSGRGTPVADAAQNARDSRSNGVNDSEDDDIFAAFNQPPTAPAGSARPSGQAETLEEDDDPFGLSSSAPRRGETVATTTTVDNDDDVLGLLGQPAPARPKEDSAVPSAGTTAGEVHPQDKALAELVDMGFPPDKARAALEQTGSGTDVQAAVGYLLNHAHSEARQKSRNRGAVQSGADSDGYRRDDGPGPQSSIRPDQPHQPPSGRHDLSRGPEKDFEQMAADFGTNFLKTAGAFWKQSTKKMQQVVQELNADVDSNGQPRWMREAERPAERALRPSQRGDEPAAGRQRRPPNEAQIPASVTDEALMLESSRPTPPPRPTAASQPQRRVNSPVNMSRGHSPSINPAPREPPVKKQPAFMRQQDQAPAAASSRSSLSRMAAEEQAAQAYVSSARRRKPPLEPQVPVTSSEADLLNGSTTANPDRQRQQAAASSNVHARPHPQPARGVETTVRPPPPPRKIPPVSELSLKASHSHRVKGNEHFKRGDYSSAHQSYATSISHLPDTHPLVIVLLTNRALTALRIGEPKAAIENADRAIAVIGPSKGESEMIDFGTGDSPKPMREYYGKALMRKAEALEQMEKWAEAAVVWREAVEGGHGGATSIQGRIRAEKAANPEAAAAAASKAKPVRSAVEAGTATNARKPAQTTGRRGPVPITTATTTTPAAAVARLRAANIAAEKADDEKFRLAELVDARVQAWKGGKADNLRALLGSLENVLWEGSGWKKISMADLVLPAKVKVQYMKGIAKVHPDKIPIDATTEQRMIAGAVFSTLNEAWDKFKAENGL